MIWVEIDWDICQVCQPCEARLSCKVRAIVQLDPDEPAFVDRTRCNGCNVCLTACPFGAIKMHSTFNP